MLNWTLSATEQDSSRLIFCFVAWNHNFQRSRFGGWQVGSNVKQYVHMLNSTLTATERTLCCLVENYQTEVELTPEP